MRFLLVARRDLLGGVLLLAGLALGSALLIVHIEVCSGYLFRLPLGDAVLVLNFFLGMSCCRMIPLSTAAFQEGADDALS